MIVKPKQPMLTQTVFYTCVADAYADSRAIPITHHSNGAGVLQKARLLSAASH